MAKAKEAFPVDRGWAWVIVGGCFVCVFFMVGTAKSTGMFLNHFKQYFDVPTSLAAMVMGGSAIVYAIMAPVCILLAQVFSVRQVIMLGGFIGFVGMSVSSLLFSIDYVIITFGICFGLGNASVYGNCLVILGLYFDKRRSLANGLALSGSSIGQFALPPLIEFLLERYGLSGCLLLMGGVYFNIVAAASLFRPLSYWASGSKSSIHLQEIKSRPEIVEVDDDSHLSPAVINGKVPIHGDGPDSSAGNSVAKNITTDEDTAPDNVDTESSHPETPLISAGGEHLAKGSSEPMDGQVAEVDSAGEVPANVNTVESNSAPGVGPPENPVTLKHRRPGSITLDTSNNVTHQNLTEDKVNNPGDKKVPHVEQCPARETSTVTFQAESETLLAYRSHMASTGSLCILPMYGSSLKLEELQSPGRGEEEQEKEEKTARGYCHDILAMFDFSVMRSYVAVLVTITNFLSFFGYFNFVLFLPATMATRGVEKYDKAILVSVTGIGDLIGRLTMAAIGDRNFMKRYKMQAFGIFAVGVNIGVLIWADTYGWMLVHCGLYGFFGGIHVSLTAVVIIDFVGMKQMPRLLAVVLLIQGIGASIGQPLLGGVRDATGSFQPVLAITSLCCVAASVVLIAYPLAVRLERRRPAHLRLLPSKPQTDDVVVV